MYKDNLLRLISGYTLCELDGKYIYITQPSPIHSLIIESKYKEIYNDAILSGGLTDDDILLYMTSNNMWSLEKQKELDELPDKIDNLKMDLYLAYVEYRKRDNIKKSIDNSRKRLLTLLEIKHSLDEHSCVGVAALTKQIYTVGYGAKYIDGTAVWPNDSFLQEDNNKILSLIKQYNMQILDDNTIRKISHGSDWKSIWGLSKNIRDIFEVSSILYLTEEQKSLVSWTQLYDNIRESQECPDDVVISDDDMLDGWLILQNKNKNSKTKNDDLTSKHGNANEVFVMVENPDDINRVNNLNTAQGKIIKKQRFDMINKLGTVSEEDFADSKQAILSKALTGR